LGLLPLVWDVASAVVVLLMLEVRDVLVRMVMMVVMVLQ
jgi:hypothetical protein